MGTFEITGGARIGLANATWPFATLRADKDKLELNASIIGNLVFRSEDIISLEPYSSFLNRGIRITHRVPHYKQQVIFWTLLNEPKTLIEEIHRTGFFANASGTLTESDRRIIEQQQSGGNPLKKVVIIVAIVLWNLLLLSDFFPFLSTGKKGMPLGYGTIIALAGLFLVSVLMLLSKDFCRLMLKEGRSVKDISRFLYMTIGISIFMLCIILSMHQHI